MSGSAEWWRSIAWMQAIYYLTTGIWPVVDIASFQAVTGPKTDLWLVQLFGVLICVPALVLAHAAYTRQPHAGVLIAGLGSAAVLLGGDVVFVAKGRIGPVYLLDAGIELILCVVWTGWAVWRSRQQTRTRGTGVRDKSLEPLGAP